MLLKNITEIDGVSGNEEQVCKYIKNRIGSYADEIKVDTMGNLIAFKKGNNSEIKVMLSAHMDEVGLIVSGHDDTGMVKFKKVGGIDDRILPGKRVTIGRERVFGIIGCKPIHMQEKEEREKILNLKDMYIDVGASGRKEAEKLAPLGEYVSFSTQYNEIGKDCIKAKALDDRAGCAILMEILKEKFNFDIYVCFTVQEEVGLRGSETAAYSISPDIAFVIEGTTCSDVPGVKEHNYSTVLGGGAVLSVADRASYADKTLVQYVYNVARSNNISVQFKRTTAGGNDAGKIQRSGTGVKVASISVPCRYIHSPASIMSKKDFESCKMLLSTVLHNLGEDKEIWDELRNGGIKIV